jgi:hypothetical protein
MIKLPITFTQKQMREPLARFICIVVLGKQAKENGCLLLQFFQGFAKSHRLESS